MDKNKKNVPKIRFPGFEGPWEKRKLEDILKRRQITQLISEDAPRLAFASGQGVIPLSERKTNNRDQLISDETTKKYLLTEIDDIVYNPANLKYGAIDRNKYGKGVISPIYVTFTTQEEPSFIERIVTTENFKSKALRFEEGTVTKRQSVSPECLLSLEVMISTSKKEQRKIGDFFQNLDSLITLHQRKLEHLKDKKKGLLQKMFPKEGEKFPELRFPGFTDPWEQRKLGEIAGIYDGVHQTPDYKDSGIMFLSVENIATLKSEKFISEEAFKRDYKVYPEKGDILMTRIGDVGTPNVVETTDKVAFYVSLALLKPSNVDSYFLCNSIHSPLFQRRLKNRTLVTAIPQKINKDEIGKVDAILPTKIEEQEKIGSYFKELDNLITLHQRKLEHLQQQKKGLLQQMFV